MCRFFRCCRVLKLILSLKLVVAIFIIWLTFIYRIYLPPNFFSNFKIGNLKFRSEFSTKYTILIWSSYDYHPFPILRQKDVFTKKKCTYQNCIVTINRDYFEGDLTKFDAIILNGRKITNYKGSSDKIFYQSHESLHQKFIYVNTGSAEHYPVCSSRFENLINWTMTYKLNSDVPFPYIQVRDKAGNIVGPKIDMEWKANMTEVDEAVVRKIENKKKAVAWFVTKCHKGTKREDLNRGMILMKELKKLGYDVDIYGPCGKFQCQSNYACNKRLVDYFFLLAYEQSFAEDYVTDVVLKALWHYTVPVVFGGANYSRFLPPGSYLDARYIPASRLAILLVNLMKRSDLYEQYFVWRTHYTFHSPMETDNVCALCAAMNDPELKKRTEYSALRSWWNVEPAPKKCKQYVYYVKSEGRYRTVGEENDV